MKISWKKTAEERERKRRRSDRLIVLNPNLPFETATGEAESDLSGLEPSHVDPQGCDPIRLAEAFQAEGNRLAEGGKFREALGKWEVAIRLLPDKAILHEQKAQVLLEIGEAWNALKAATRATELEPSWAEAWITLGRAQLNYGEPDLSIESFNRALEIKPGSKEALADRETAKHLVQKREQRHSSELNSVANRYQVRDKAENS
ncbi:TPR-like protein [Dioscorea alata]|uniref:TPR-like protein n=1 Tax=Dioscorea alata TaxID=55571 RepID=A0ACB7W0Z3_DIOAL|nr:TPR-like protein [Dioscorea alata]